jgi:hypothetical protein
MTRRSLLLVLGLAAACTDDGHASDTGTESSSGDASSESSSVGSDETSNTSQATTMAMDTSTGSGEPFVPEGTIADALPLEVVGVCPEQGTCAELAAAIEIGSLPDDVADLRVRLVVHNVVQPESAELALNGGDAIALGLVRPHGGFAIGEVVLDPAALQRETNWLTFRYTRQVPDVSGFRVLEAALEADGVELGRVELPWSDPAAWQAPSDDIEAGRAYFTEVSRDEGPVCAACHARDGADLQYFAFSNHGIVERSRHHLFTRDEAEAIASYLRSLPTPAVGRVYEPPFQPGSDNALAGGAGRDAVVDDDAFGEAVFGPGGWESLPSEVAWTWALDEGIDPYRLPAPVQVPAWFQWLPRSINPVWFEIPLDGDGSTLRDAELALVTDGSVESAQRFMAFAVALGNRILAGSDPKLSRPSDHGQRIQLLRFAAVRLWEWSRAQDDFADPERGFPIGTPPYPYEVGFAFFEAAHADALATDAWRQTIEWWWVQLTLDAGRGASNGQRPLDYADVLDAAAQAGLGPNALVFLHLWGSWEESRGTMEDLWGTDLGPARLLSTPMYTLPSHGIALLFRRFLHREAQWLAQGGTLEPAHHDALANAWATHCAMLSNADRSELRSIVDDPAVQSDLAACP